LQESQEARGPQVADSCGTEKTGRLSNRQEMIIIKVAEIAEGGCKLTDKNTAEMKWVNLEFLALTEALKYTKQTVE
jgi:hypothetical protein